MDYNGSYLLDFIFGWFFVSFLEVKRSFEKEIFFGKELGCFGKVFS
jgi:hypothetical protein